MSFPALQSRWVAQLLDPLQGITGQFVDTSAQTFPPEVVYHVTVPYLEGSFAVAFAPSVTLDPNLDTPVVGSTANVLAPELAYAVVGPTLGPDSLTLTPTLAYDVTVPFLEATSQVFLPTVGDFAPLSIWTRGLGMFPNLMEQRFNNAALQAGDYNLALPFLDAGSVVFAPNISGGLVDVMSRRDRSFRLAPRPFAPNPFIQLRGQGPFSPQVAFSQPVDLPFIGATSSVAPPEVLYVVELPFVVSTSLVTQPEEVRYVVLVPAIAASSQEFAPMLTTGQDVTGAFLNSASQVFQPSQAMEVSLPSIGPDTALSAPAIFPEVLVPFLGSTEQTFTPALTFTIFLPFLENATQVFGQAVAGGAGGGGGPDRGKKNRKPMGGTVRTLIQTVNGSREIHSGE